MLDASLLPLCNERAAIRPMAPADAIPYASGTTDPAVRRYGHLPEPAYTEDSVRALINGHIKDGLNRGDLAVLTIADPETDVFAGSLVLFDLDAESAEVGFWVHPRHRGKGLGRAALSLAGEFAKRSGCTALRARTVPENRSSRRVLEKSDFMPTGTAEGTAPSGETITLLHYRRRLHPPRIFPLETRRLRLRLHEHRDARELHAIYGRADVAEFLLEDPWTREDAERQVSGRMVKTGFDDGGSALSLAIELDGGTIGDVALWLTAADRRIAEIGWVLDPAHGGRGLAAEAVRRVLDLAFGHYGLHRVEARMDARNDASSRLARRVGMVREAHLRKDWWNKGEWTDTLVYGILAEDWRA